MIVAKIAGDNHESFSLVIATLEQAQLD